MSEARLYTQNINPFSMKVVLALALKKIPVQRVMSDDPEDIKRWSPITQRLPVLEIDGERIHDSGEILRWLDLHYPEPPLLARDPKTAATQEQLAAWSDTSFLWYWDRWRQARFPLPGDERPAPASLVAKLRSGIERTLGRPVDKLSRVELREAEVFEGMGQRMDDLVGFLGERDFFYADQPSVADLSVYAMLKVIAEGPMALGPQLVRERPALAAYMERMEKIRGDEG